VSVARPKTNQVVRPRHIGIVAVLGCAGSMAVAQAAYGDDRPGAPRTGEERRTAAAPASIDRTTVRFFAPEIGGVAYPRFIFERVLAFEARLAEMAENPEGIGESYGERDVREAIDRHVAEEILASLADRLIAEAAPGKRPTSAELAAVERNVGTAFVERVGGRKRLDAAAQAEQIEHTEVEVILRRASRAAFYIDRAVTPILHPSDDQLRNVFRASSHPYRRQPFEQVRAELERWFVIERTRVAESAFLQAARSRVQVIVTP
jgi:hypothetical protein